MSDGVVDCPKLLTINSVELSRVTREAYENGYAAGVAAPRTMRVILKVVEYRPNAHANEEPTDIRRFAIELTDGEATIVRQGRPLLERDRSTSIPCGEMPLLFDVVLEVEADPTS